MLFLLALRDVAEDNNIKIQIEKRYLKNENVSDDSEYKIKLKQVETDWQVYCDLILGKTITDKEKLSAIYQNYIFFCQKIKQLREELWNLDEMITYGLAKFSVVTVELEPEKNSWENPQEIFESMNSLGKPLTLADLVRNYLLLGKDPDKQNHLYKNYWMHIEEKLSGHVSSFIRDYMQLVSGRAYKQATEHNYKELYADFKDQFTNKSTEELLTDLCEYSDYYACIINTDENSTGYTNIDKKLEDIMVVGVSTAYSFIMGLYKSWKSNRIVTNDFAEILDALIIYFLRRRLSSLTSGENKAIPALVKKIPDIEYSTLRKKKMFEILAKQENSLRLPNDAEVERQTMALNFYNFRLCKFVLSLIEEMLTKSRPDMSDPNLQIEHIMPQKMSNDWNIELGPDAQNVHDKYVNNIGNLTLIRHNQELGNKKFADKKETYDSKSGLQIAREEITNRTKWNKASIENRTKWIIGYMLSSVIPIPDDMRKTNNFDSTRKKGLSFVELQLIGQTINYVKDISIVVTVVNDTEVEFEGRKWKLSPLTCEIEKRRGTVNASGAYQGAQYWEYDGIILADIM